MHKLAIVCLRMTTKNVPMNDVGLLPLKLCVQPQYWHLLMVAGCRTGRAGKEREGNKRGGHGNRQNPGYATVSDISSTCCSQT